MLRKNLRLLDVAKFLNVDFCDPCFLPSVKLASLRKDSLDRYTMRSTENLDYRYKKKKIDKKKKNLPALLVIRLGYIEMLLWERSIIYDTRTSVHYLCIL